MSTLGQTHMPEMLFDGDAGVIRDLLPQPGELVEERSLTGIRWAYECDKRRLRRRVLRGGAAASDQILLDQGAGGTSACVLKRGEQLHAEACGCLSPEREE